YPFYVISKGPWDKRLNRASNPKRWGCQVHLRDHRVSWPMLLTRLPSDNIWYPQRYLPPQELIRHVSIQSRAWVNGISNMASSVRLRIRSSSTAVLSIRRIE